MSIRNTNTEIQAAIAANGGGAEFVEAANTPDLGEGATGFNNLQANPYCRRILVGIRSTLGKLSTDSGASTWAPSPSAVASMLKQKQFVDLSGKTEMVGDLKSVVLHQMSTSNISSTFPIAVGAHITGVDDKVFSPIGKSFGMIALPNEKTKSLTVLQEEDPSIANDFAKRYPGYTADNLEQNGVHKVNERRFVLVAATHPLVTAIQENSKQLQTSDITQMPEELVKISSSLYDSLMPLVQRQIRSQIKVADYSNMNVTIEPAEYRSWKEACDRLSSEGTATLRAAQRRALRAADNDQALIDKINKKYDAEIAEKMEQIANAPLEFHVELKMEHNFLGDGSPSD